MFGFFRRRHRRHVRHTPFPDAWQHHLDTLPYVSLLTPAERRTLCGHILTFLDEKTVEGVKGFVVNDEVRLTIAAHACILLLGWPEADAYRSLRTILVYPKAFAVPHQEVLEGGLLVEGLQGRSGESWHRGPIVLNWDDICYDIENVQDGQNVIFHEFAHQLDDAVGGTDGAPILPTRQAAQAWHAAFSAAYDRLHQHLRQGRQAVLNAYAAVSPAEFFAVSTEAFFETPARLRRWDATLYEQLQAFYHQNPTTRLAHSEDIL